MGPERMGVGRIAMLTVTVAPLLMSRAISGHDLARVGEGTRDVAGRWRD